MFLQPCHDRVDLVALWSWLVMWPGSDALMILCLGIVLWRSLCLWWTAVPEPWTSHTHLFSATSPKPPTSVCVSWEPTPCSVTWWVKPCETQPLPAGWGAWFSCHGYEFWSFIVVQEDHFISGVLSSFWSIFGVQEYRWTKSVKVSLIKCGNIVNSKRYRIKFDFVKFKLTSFQIFWLWWELLNVCTAVLLQYQRH